MPGKENDLEKFRSMRYIFDRNHTEMEDFFESGSEDLREERRVVHNFLASAYTLTEHEENVADRTGIDAYTWLKENDVLRYVGLMRDIRKIVQHIYEPPVGHGEDLEETDGDSHTQYFIHREKLDELISRTEDREWRSESEKILEPYGEKINLRELMKEIYTELDGFFDWFHKELQDTAV